MEGHQTERTERPPILFTCKQQHRKEFWQFIKLAAVAVSAQQKPVDQLNSSDAEFAYCLKCECSIAFKKGKHEVKKHMETFHLKEMADFIQRRNEKKAEFNARLSQLKRPIDATNHDTISNVSQEQQRHANELLALWVARSNRPISIVDDIGFQDYVSYVTRNLGGVALTIPSRTQVRNDVIQLAARLRTTIEDAINTCCHFYCVTTDCWTDRPGRSYMSLTLHYVTDNFRIQNWTLEVISFPGKHTGLAISNGMETLFRNWNLNKNHCVKLLRDGAANMVLAGGLMGISHMSCIAHSLHLVVSGILIRKRTPQDNVEGDVLRQQLNLNDNDGGDGDYEGDEEIVHELDSYLAQILSNHQLTSMDKVRKVVQAFRDIAAYFHFSPKASSRLEKIQERAGRKKLRVVLDCPTRWNSCRDMLARMLEISEDINDFFRFLDSDIGHDEFGELKLLRPCASQWFIVRCLLIMLEPFAFATEMLSAESYPTLSMVLPALRAVKVELMKTDMFVNMTRDAIQNGQTFANRMSELMNDVRKTILDIFRERFSGLDIEVLWVSALDPRMSRMAHATTDEIAFTYEQVVVAAVDLAKSNHPGQTLENEYNQQPSPIPTPKKLRRSMTTTMFGDRERRPPDHSSEQDQALTATIKIEFEKYLSISRHVAMDTDPFVWWRVNSGGIENIACLARKWLRCAATSVSSERAFSTAQNTVTARRSSLTTSLVRDLVFIASNYKCTSSPKHGGDHDA